MLRTPQLTEMAISTVRLSVAILFPCTTACGVPFTNKCYASYLEKIYEHEVEATTEAIED